MVLEKDQVVGGQEAPGKLGHQRLFPAQSLAQGEGRNPQRQGLLEVAGAAAHPYHGVLVIDFNDNDGGIVS